MPQYETIGFDPPAPVARVVLRNPERGASIAGVPLLLDTGADVTLLPRESVQQIGVAALADQSYELMGFDGSKSFASVVMLDLRFLNRVFRGRYLLIAGESGILGRDILKHVTVLLDGPKEQWSERLP